MSDPLYIDIETIPDESRRHLYETPVEDVGGGDLGPALAIQQTKGKAIDELLRNPRLTLDWLCQAHVAEQGRFEVTGSPSRVTVLDKIAKRIGSLGTTKKGKPPSLVPEHCRIVAFGFGDHFETWSETGERAALSEFWERINGNVSIVGWNIIGFDLDVILARSALLGITPTRCLAGLKPWDNGVVDLMLKRPNRRRCGEIAVEYGFEDQDDIDGSEVAALWASDPAKVVEHVEQDIERLRHIHRAWNGYFVPAFDVPAELEAPF